MKLQKTKSKMLVFRGNAHLALFFAFCFLLFALTGCNLPAEPAAAQEASIGGVYLVTANPRATATPTPFQPLLPTPTPIPPTETPTATLPPPTEVPTPTPVPPTATPFSANLVSVERPQYLMYVLWDYNAHYLWVEQQVIYTNHSPDTLYDVVLAIEPNFWQGYFNLKSLSVNGVAAYYDLSSHQLTVSLPQPLAPGETLLMALSYEVQIPYKSSGLVYGYTEWQTNLVDWYPFIVPYQAGVGWILHDVYPWGENLVYNASDFEVNLHINDPASAPVIAASVPSEPNGDWTRYRAYSARTISFSASPYFVTSTVVSPNGIPVTSYYFSGYEYSGQAIADYGAQALGVYSEKFGAYAYPSLSIVETYLPDGMEYDGMVFISSRFYDSYNGSAASELTYIGVHEIAHQWWFGKVGNDQTLEPWLDEAMSLYSERVFYENTSPGLLGWWWDTRVYNYSPTGWVDTTVYNGGGFRTYTDAVYLVGGYFLEELRNRIGDEAFFSFLKDYAAQMAGRNASAADFFNILRTHTSTDFSDITARYFQYAR